MMQEPEPKFDALNLLSLCDLFCDLDPNALSPAELGILSAEVEIVRLTRGEVLMRQGDPSDCMYALVSGRFQVFAEGVVVLAKFNRQVHGGGPDHGCTSVHGKGAGHGNGSWR